MTLGPGISARARSLTTKDAPVYSTPSTQALFSSQASRTFAKVMRGRRSWHRWSRWPAAAALLRVMLETPHVHAAPPEAQLAEAFRIIESSSAGCGRAGTFASELRSRTNRLRPAQEGEHAIILIVETFEANGGVRGQLTVHRLDGAMTVREVPGRDCQEVESAMALIAALMVDPLAGNADGGRASPPPPNPRSGLLATPQPSNWSIRIEPRLTARTAVAPRVAWGGALGLMMTLETSELRPSFGLAGHFARASTTQPSGSADLELSAAQLVVCPFGWRPRAEWDLRACGLFQAGRLRGAGFDTVNPAEKSIFWASAGLELEARFQLLGPVWLGLEVAGELPFSRESFYVEPGQTLHRVPAWGMSFGLGAGVLFF